MVLLPLVQVNRSFASSTGGNARIGYENDSGDETDVRIINV